MPKKRPKAETLNLSDPRIEALEKAQGVALEEDQRRRLAEELKSIDETGAAARKLFLPDGGAEPCFVFQPLRPNRDA